MKTEGVIATFLVYIVWMGQHSCLSLPLSTVNQHITTPTYLLPGKPQNSENGGHHIAKTLETTDVTTNGSHVQSSHPSTVNPTQHLSQTLLDNTDEQTISVTRQGETITEDDVPSPAQHVCDRSQKGYNGSHSDTFSTLVMEAQDLMDHITESQMQYLTCFSDQPAIGLVDSLHMVPCLSELVTGEINSLQITTGSRVACTHADFRSTEKVVAAFVAVSRSLRQT